MRLVLRSSLAVLVAVAAGWFVAVPPASAAACTKGTGVTVVVGGDVRCVSGGGGNAAGTFGAAGHSLTYAKRQPGFVCRVNGAPGNDPCVNASPANAYWGLFWSNGTSGKWIYSNTGVGSLSVPAGGWVAFVFQDGGSTDYPGPRPIGPTPPPAPKPTTPKPKPTSASSTEPAPTAARPKGGDAEKGDEPEKREKGEKAADGDVADENEDGGSAGPSTERVQPTSAEAPASSPALWGGVALAVLLLAGLGVVAVQRRKASG